MGALISGSRIAAAHDGSAELVVTLEYPSGATSEVPLDAPATEALFVACNASGPDDLIGQPWAKVRDALATAFNRFNTSA